MVLLLSVIGFGYLVNGMTTVPNWDYYKYNTLLDGIYHAVLRPSVVWGQDGKPHELAYYYAIFLPSIWLSKAIGCGHALTIFHVQAVFIGVNVLVASVLLSSVLSEIKNRWSFIFLLLFLVGLDGLFLPLMTWGTFPTLINDIQNGGVHWFFSPLRIQDFGSYFFWLPGHAIAAVAAMRVLIGIDRGMGDDRRFIQFVSGPFLLYLASTSVFSFLSFGVALFVMVLMKNGVDFRGVQKMVVAHRHAAVCAFVVVAFMGVFYGYHREYAKFSIFISLHMMHLGVAKWALFVLQEFGLFMGFYWAYQIRKEFIVFVGIMILGSLGASRDLLMSSSILFLLMMTYFASERWSVKNNIVAAVIIGLLGFPSLALNGLGIFDFSHEYSDSMTSAEAKGDRCQAVINDVIKGYIRK
jgi:hypothetical protein